MMVPIVALLLFVLFVLRPLVKFLTTPAQHEYDLSKLLPSELLQADQVSGQGKASGPGGALANGQQRIEGGGSAAEGSHQGSKKGGIPDLESSIDLEQFDEIVAENQRLVKENPQQAALLIRYWLNDGRLQ
jgi:flagellar biosynthesis/type III secretory pathway M-ring protein FliF/YscJ